MAAGKGNRGGIVYSTGHGRMCPRCSRPIAGCSCSRAMNGVSSQAGGGVTLRKETAGRRGKEVTRISGVPLAAAQIASLCRDLKKECGSGGTVKEGVIEIQGDHRDRIAAALEKQGWKVRQK